METLNRPADRFVRRLMRSAGTEYAHNGETVGLPGRLQFWTSARGGFALISIVASVVLVVGCSGRDRPPTAPSGLQTPAPPPVTPVPRPGPAVDLTGSYELTFIASPICATVVDAFTHQPMPFPESVRTRRYPAEVTQDAVGNVQMVLRRGECDPCTADGRGGALDATLSGRVLSFGVPGSDICAGGDYWWESLSQDREWFEVCGVWTASVDDPRQIAGIHAGTLAYHHLLDPLVPEHRGGTWVDLYCHAADHRFTLTKTP